MTAVLSSVYGAGEQLFNNTGAVLAGGKINTYLAGTTTPAATWTDSTQAVQNANPVILDSYGRPSTAIWLANNTAYKFVVTDANNNQIGTVIDNIPGVNSSNVTQTEWVTGSTPSYISSTSFSVPGNLVATYAIGRRVQFSVNSGTYYGTIASSVYNGTSLTTIVITVDSTAMDSSLSGVNYGFLNSTPLSVPNFLSPPTGSSLVGFQQSGTGAVARTVQDEIRELRISVTQYGAKGDGVTDDTAAIKLAIAVIKLAGGGTLFFPKTSSYYNIAPVTGANVTSWGCVFALGSNTRVEFAGGAQIVCNGSANTTAGGLTTSHMGLFGFDWSLIPLANIWFVNVNIKQPTILATNYESLAAIQPTSTSNTTVPGSLKNVYITGALLDYANIYCVNRTDSSTTLGTPALLLDRVTQNLVIDKCVSINTAGSFATIDANGVVVNGCVAVGINGAQSYDAVSSHCAMNATITNNVFSNFTSGQVINVRDSIENGCGASNITITGNTIHDCQTTAIQVATVGSPIGAQGVTNVSITGNTIYNCTSSINVSRSGTSKLKCVSVAGNTIYNCLSGIQSLQTIANDAENISITGNSVIMPAASNTDGLAIQGIVFGTVSGNTITSDNVGTTYRLVQICATSDVTVNGNTFYTAATNSGGYICEFGFIGGAVRTNYSLTCVGNDFKGTVKFDNFNGSSKVKANNFQNTVTIGGNVLGISNVEYDNGLVTFGSSASPTSGTFTVGDKAINTTPSPSSYIGWVCTTSGLLPGVGVFKGYGSIQA